MTGKMKWLLSILGISVVLNVFALGLFVGKGVRTVVPSDRERTASPPVDFQFRRLERNLPVEQREKVRGLLREKSQDLRKGYRSLRKIEQQIKKVILAETVDQAALREALIKHSEKARALHDPMRRVMLETIAGLDFETRKKIVNDMFRGPGKRRQRSGPPPHRRSPPPRDREFEDQDCEKCGAGT